TVPLNCSVVGVPGCTPASVSSSFPAPPPFTFPPIDVAGNSTQCTFRVIVLPVNLPPVPEIDVSPLTRFPGNTNLIIIVPNGTGIMVSLDGSRSYDPDDPTFLYSWSEAGNVFSTNAATRVDLTLGTHTIILSLDDTYPYGTNSLSVILEVMTPSEALQIISDLITSHLSSRNQQPLLASLLAASAAFDRGNLTTGTNMLRAFQ